MGRVNTLSFVVGGSEGIGAAIAEQLTAEGRDVVVLSRSPSKLAVALERLEGLRRHPGQTLQTRVVDVTDAVEMSAIIDDLVSVHGVPDLVVCTSGYARPGWLGEIPADDVRGMVEVNLLGTINLTRAVVPHLRAAGRGTIVTTSSMAGLAGVFGYTVYSATKFGVIGLSEALRRELEPYGVRVVVLCPPNTLTPGFEAENLHKPAEVLAAEQKAGTMTADEVAVQLLRALRRRRRFVVVPGRSNRLAAFAIRHLPWLVDRELRRPVPGAT